MTQNRQCLLVLGMHRSGTSAFTGILSCLGVTLGNNLMDPAEDNEKGFFENNFLIQINENILKSIDSSWDSLHLLPENWWKNDSLSIYKDEIKAYLSQEFNNTVIFGIKDPRMCRLLPLWLEIFTDLNIQPKIIITIRNPLEVAGSLKKRDGFSIEKATILWMNHMLEAEVYSRNLSRVFCTIDELLSGPAETVAKIETSLNMKFPCEYSEVKYQIETFLDQNLKHHHQTHSSVSLPNFVNDFYNMLLNLSKNTVTNDVFKTIDDLRCQYQHLNKYFYNQEIIDIHQKFSTVYKTKLYIDTGSGFNETRVKTCKISGYDKELIFDLNGYPEISGLLLNPINEISEIKIKKINITDKDNRKFTKFTIHSNALMENEHTFLFDSDEPQILLKFSSACQISKVHFELEYELFSRGLYKKILENMNRRIKNFEQLLEKRYPLLLRKLFKLFLRRFK
jgi:hypothetical protein